LAEIRKIKPTRAEMYARIEADVDEDGQTLVLEFPADQDFAMQMAEDPDMRELLQRALGAVMGAAPPVRFKLANAIPRTHEVEAVEPVAAVSSASQSDGSVPSDQSVPEYFETVAAPHPWVADQAPEQSAVGSLSNQPEPSVQPTDAGASSNLTRQLMQSLGAEIVEERPAGLGDASDLAADGEAETDLRDIDSSDFGLKDPELFDNDDREDES
jgi:hypothetical protein